MKLEIQSIIEFSSILEIIVFQLIIAKIRYRLMYTFSKSKLSFKADTRPAVYDDNARINTLNRDIMIMLI